MKMTKASEADLNMAMELCGALDELTGWGASVPKAVEKVDGDDDGETFYRDNREQCERVLGYLIDLANKASLMRVVWGCAVMLDPRNKLVDPNSDTIEHHPERKDSARLQWLLADHDDPAVRVSCMELIERLPTMGYGAATQQIDAYMAEADAAKKVPA